MAELLSFFPDKKRGCIFITGRAFSWCGQLSPGNAEIHFILGEDLRMNLNKTRHWSSQINLAVVPNHKMPWHFCDNEEKQSAVSSCSPGGMRPLLPVAFCWPSGLCWPTAGFLPSLGQAEEGTTLAGSFQLASPLRSTHSFCLPIS